MATDDPFHSRIIQHITHFSNLPLILQSGGLMCDAHLAQGTAVSIAYGEIKQRRAVKRVMCAPGGFVSEYVPFYFAPRSPMLYAIHCGCVPQYSGGQSEIIYLVSSIATVRKLRLQFVFTDGHPVVGATRFFNNLADLTEVDWDVMKARTWHNTSEDPDRKRRRQAEFLIHHFCPWQAIDLVAVYDTDMRMIVQSLLASAAVQQPMVTVRRYWYY